MALTETQHFQVQEFFNQSNFAESGGVITDLDGTAIHEYEGRYSIPQSVELGLQKIHELGRPVVINTLRFPLSVMRAFGKEWCSISNQPVPTVLMNGSQLGYIVQSDTGVLSYEEIAAFPLQKEEIMEVLQIARNFIDNNVIDLLVFYYPREWKCGEIIWTPAKEKITDVKQKYLSASSVISGTTDQLQDELLKQEVCMIFLLIDIPQDKLMAYQHTKKSSFFTTKGVDKNFGAVQIADKLGFKLEHSVGAGDSVMDTFLTSVGLAVHVGNPYLKFEGVLPPVRLESSTELGELFLNLLPCKKQSYIKMSKRSAAEVRIKTEMVKKIIKHHFRKLPKKIQFKPAGLTNFVFEVNTSEGEFIVRIAGKSTKTNDFIKEQWVTERVRERGVPVPEILEVGNEIISLPYMLQRKLEGNEAVDHPKRLDILYELGSYATLIHSVHTSNFGKVFDWSQNRLSKNETWIDFLEDELDFANRLRIFKKANIFTSPKLNKLTILYERIKKWKIAPRLNHGDLRLKNVIANDEGKIIAIIDWENCVSSIAPYWDFSIALHDLSMDGKQKFLEGYGLDFNEFNRMAYSLKVFNIVNYAHSIEKIIAKNQTTKLEYYRLRLNGYLDLFSL